MYTPSDSLIELTAVHISILRFLPLDFGFAVAGSKEREREDSVQLQCSTNRIDGVWPSSSYQVFPSVFHSTDSPVASADRPLNWVH